MKIKNLFLIGVALLMASGISYAGHNETKRNGCWFLNKRFKAEAHVTLWWLTPVCAQRGGNCNFIEAQCSNGNCGAKAFAHSAWDGQWGYFYKCGIYRAGINSDIFQDLAFDAPPEEGTADDGYAEESNNAQVEFTETSVNIASIKVDMFSSNTVQGENSYTLTVWAPHDDEERKIEDDEINEDEILYQTKVTIVNGEVTVEGNLLNPSDFSIENTGEGTNVQYVGGEISVEIPEAYVGSVLAVTSSGDFINNDVEAMSQSLELSDFSQSINVYPNPANDYITIQGNWEDKTALEYGIYDITGKSVISKNSKMVARGENLGMDISRLAPGNYYLMIKSGNNRSVKSFVKQ